MRVVALDPSLACTGVAATDLPRPHVIRPVSRLSGPARLYWIQHEVAAAATGADLVVIEGYSYGSKNKAHQLGELGGVIRLALWCRNIPMVVIQPTLRMKIATGSGMASKEAVMAAAIHRLGYMGHSFDEADALWLLEWARQYYRLPGAVALPKAHLELTKKSRIEWPTLHQELAG